ncbi:MAG TPA: lamin tail domain-containing protein [Polyangiaceae bacterium]
MKSARFRLFAFASVSTLLACGVLAGGCSGSGGNPFSDEDSGSEETDGSKKGDATVADGGGFGSDSGKKDSGEEEDATVDEDSGTPKDSGTTDGSIVMDSGIDSGTTVDAGSDASTTVDAGVDSGTPDAGPVDAGPAAPLVISEVQSRGTGGGNDDFVEIYNPTASDVVLDSAWQINARSAVGTCTSNATATRWTGTGKTIPAHGHFLVANMDYTGSVARDELLGSGIVDASSVMLVHAGTVVDSLCFYFNAATQTSLTSCSTPYVCEGTPVMNTHDNTTAGGSNSNTSLERKPGGSAGNGTDTNDNLADFVATTASNPQRSTSPATP